MLIMISGVLEAQSYHFSQFFSTPLLTNPANTGLIDGSYRVASNLRSQGKSAPNSFFTGYVSGDVSILKNSLPAEHKAGAGVLALIVSALVSREPIINEGWILTGSVLEINLVTTAMMLHSLPANQ
jgi:hypothetical protein